MQTFFQNSGEQIDGDGGPDLDAHRVGRGAVKGFDAQMLLDPFEEEFDWPAAAIEFRAEGRQTGFDVAQTFASGQLDESQHEELFVSGEFADAAAAVVTGDTLVELVLGEEVAVLGEEGATFVHKVENRRNAGGGHTQGIVAELKQKMTKQRFYPVFQWRNRCQQKTTGQ
jgi:hypothetical protein